MAQLACLLFTSLAQVIPLSLCPGRLILARLAQVIQFPLRLGCKVGVLGCGVVCSLVDVQVRLQSSPLTGSLACLGSGGFGAGLVDVVLHLILRSLGIASSAVEVVSACAEGAEAGVQSGAALWGGGHCDRDVRELVVVAEVGYGRKQRILRIEWLTKVVVEL
ncbi:hypothetical protein BDV11DRAFT_182554 [Aspergillus similis]